MPLLPVLGGLLRAGASVGLIRGTAGRLLGGGARKVLTGPITSSIPGGIAGAAPAAVGKILRSKAGKVVATGAGFEIGSQAVQRFRKDGKPFKRRTMNPANPKALRKALSRVERFQQLVKRSFIVSDIKPRKARKCR